jgi:hypothetical protein
MSTIPATADGVSPRVWLRRWLAIDAIATGANAVAYLLATGPVGRLLGLESALLIGVGAFLLPYAAIVGWLAYRQDPPALAVRCVVEANLVWVVASLAALALWLDPSTTGGVYIPTQAAAVAALAALQYGALRATAR